MPQIALPNSRNCEFDSHDVSTRPKTLPTNSKIRETTYTATITAQLQKSRIDLAQYSVPPTNRRPAMKFSKPAAFKTYIRIQLHAQHNSGSEQPRPLNVRGRSCGAVGTRLQKPCPSFMHHQMYEAPHLKSCKLARNHRKSTRRRTNVTKSRHVDTQTDAEGYPTGRCQKQTTPTGHRRHANTCRLPFCPKFERVLATRSALPPWDHERPTRQLLDTNAHQAPPRATERHQAPSNASQGTSTPAFRHMRTKPTKSLRGTSTPGSKRHQAQPRATKRNHAPHEGATSTPGTKQSAAHQRRPRLTRERTLPRATTNQRRTNANHASQGSDPRASTNNQRRTNANQASRGSDLYLGHRPRNQRRTNANHGSQGTSPPAFYSPNLQTVGTRVTIRRRRIRTHAGGQPATHTPNSSPHSESTTHRAKTPTNQPTNQNVESLPQSTKTRFELDPSSTYANLRT